MTDSALPDALVDAEPSTVWRHFADLCRIPRCSGNEDGVREHIMSFAKERGIDFDVDDVGNLVLRVRPDQPGDTICLQGHMDMVCVAEEGSTHDFARDPIVLRRVGDDLYANETTLGADNGIGLAYGLAAIDATDGPLEILCTVDEEVGLIGASGLQPGWLKSRFLLNLDSEEEGFITVACAGGRDLLVELDSARSATTRDLQIVDVKVKGLKGGHSGIDIGCGRTNANRVLAAVLREVLVQGGVIFSIDGGVKRNAIPPVASATVGLDEANVLAFESASARIRDKFSSAEDPDLAVLVSTSPGDPNRPPFNTAVIETLLGLLTELPDGVLEHVPNDPDAPFVSANMALVSEKPENKLRVTMSVRSPSADKLDQLEHGIQSIATKHGAKCICENGYPGWEPDYDSPLLAAAQRIHSEYFGKPPKLLEIHAGLECGIIGAKYPEMHMISIGPDIHDPHSPRERVSIPSVERMFGYVIRLVNALNE